MLLAKLLKGNCRKLLSLAISILAILTYGYIDSDGVRNFGAAANGDGSRVLVVYNANEAESLEVANYYVARRGIPEANKCGIAVTSTVGIDYGEFQPAVRTPIQNCLDAVGRSNILYIVFTYLTPYKIWDSPAVGAMSLDQHVADVWNQTGTFNPYYAASQSKNSVYQSFVSFANYRASYSANIIYSVWRLDAPTADLAKGLVDKALAAEANGLQGIGCFDQRAPVSDAVSDSGYPAVDWNIYRAAGIIRARGFTVIEDSNGEEIGTAPAPLRCDNAAFYSSGYSYDNYNDAFTWNVGAIGFHIDSASAGNPRGGNNWSANAIQRGITVTAGAVAEPYVEYFPQVDGVFHNLVEGANVGDALLRNTPKLTWNFIYLGDPLYRPFSTTPSPSPTPTPTPTPEPSPTPTPEPSPTPTPEPSPTPTPEPSPAPPCTMTAPSSIEVPSGATWVIEISLNSMSWVDGAIFTVYAVSDSPGQVYVFPSSQPSPDPLTGTSAVVSFGVQVKRKSGLVTFTSPCGTATTNVLVN